MSAPGAHSSKYGTPITHPKAAKITTIATCFHMINPLTLLSCYLQVTIEKNIRNI